VIFQLIRQNVPPPSTIFRFVINVDAIDGRNRWKIVPVRRQNYEVIRCLRSSQCDLPWRTITPTCILPTSQTFILLPQIFPISTLFVMNLRCHRSGV
jgi:hypothetical protein